MRTRTGRRPARIDPPRPSGASPTLPLAAPAGWHRPHRLVAMPLAGYRQRSQPELVALTLRRASQSFEQHDLLEEAITHRLAAHDSVRAAALIEQIAHQLVGQPQIT